MRRALDESCRAMLARVSAYLDGELGATECTAIDRHCLACRDCAAVITGLRRTIGLCRAAGRAPVPDLVRTRARRSINRLLSRAAAPAASRPRHPPARRGTGGRAR